MYCSDWSWYDESGLIYVNHWRLSSHQSLFCWLIPLMCSHYHKAANSDATYLLQPDIGHFDSVDSFLREAAALSDYGVTPTSSLSHSLRIQGELRVKWNIPDGRVL